MVEKQAATAQPLRKPRRRSSDWHVGTVEGESESWLLTYLDVMTLLLVMLVVLLAFADFDAGVGSPDAPATAARVEQGSPEVLPGGAGIMPEADQRPVPAEGRSGSADPEGSLQALAEQLQQVLGDDIDVLTEGGTLSFRVGSELLFESARAALTAQGRRVMSELATVLEEMPYDIAVEGHTDSRPIQTERFPSNWELSTARATSVVRHLAEQGVAVTRLRATGYAHTRPVADNATMAGRAANRRVELVMQLGSSGD